METLETICNRLRSISIDQISSKRSEGMSFGERLDQIKNDIRGIDLHKEFKGKGKQVAEEIRTELSQTVSECSQINIIEALPDGPEIQGGFLDITGSYKLPVVIAVLVDIYFTLIGKAKLFERASGNVYQISDTLQQVNSEEADPSDFGRITSTLYNLLLQDPVLKHDMNRLLNQSSNLTNLDLTHIKKIMLQAIENSGITKVATAYRDQYAIIAQYIRDLTDATRTHIIDPIIDTLKGPEEIVDFFARKLEELLRRKEQALQQSLSN